MKDFRLPGKVSVVIPTYNRAQYIGNAIESVRSQSYRNYEIIVVNDGSSDDTDRVIEPFIDSILYVKQGNQGASAARNRGIQESNGEWISFLDSDDLWHPNKLDIQISELKNTPQVRAHSVNSSVQRPSLESSDFFKSIGFATMLPSSFILERPFAQMVEYHFAWLGTTLLHHSLIEEVGTLNAKYPIYEDFDFLLRTAEKTPWAINKNSLVEILRRPGSIPLSSIRTEKAQQSLSHMLEIHLNADRRNKGLQKDESRVLQLAIFNCYRKLFNHLLFKRNGTSAIRRLMNSVRHFSLFAKFLVRFVASYLRIH